MKLHELEVGDIFSIRQGGARWLITDTFSCVVDVDGTAMNRIKAVSRGGQSRLMYAGESDNRHVFDVVLGPKAGDMTGDGLYKLVEQQRFAFAWGGDEMWVVEGDDGERGLAYVSREWEVGNV